MDVSEIFSEDIQGKYIENMKVVEVTGWLVVIDAKLFVLEEHLADPYVLSKKIEISNSSIAFVVRDNISPLGGGKSFVFHKAKVVGVLITKPSLKIEVRDLYVQGDQNEFIRISLADDDIKKAEKKYGDFLMKKDQIKSDDWLDYL